MKHLLLTTIAAVLMVGCGESQPPDPTTAKASDISINQAIFAGNIDAVKQALAAGVDVNTKKRMGGTPLRLAAGEGHKEIVELLISEGADMNAKDIDGETPLHRAAERKQTGIAELLIDKGSDVNAVGKYGTPLDFAIRVKQTEIADLLRKHGGKTGEELKAAAK